MNVLSIQSEVVYGHVGNAAARFALQRLGFEVWGVPTVLLSSHPGHPGFAGEATPLPLLTKLVDALEAQGRFGEAHGVLSGYLGSPEQAALVADVVRRAKRANPKLIYCLDPAFGDDGRIYARPGVAEAMGEILLPLADIVTPNAFELSVLAGTAVTDPDSAAAAIARLGRPLVVAKSIPFEGRLGAMTLLNGATWVAATPIVADAPRGPGDLFAALFFGHYLHGRLTIEALDLATRGIYHVLSHSSGAPEMNLIAEQDALADPPQPAGYSLGPIDPEHPPLAEPLRASPVGKERGNGLFGVYVHWPFCTSKCPYCDFNSHVHHGAFDETAYVRSYEREIAWFAEQAPGRTVQSIFFGGGTPSLMSPDAVGAILDSIARHWAVDPKAEITLEANPTSVEANRFRGYRAAGVNRVSLGVQSLRPGPLAQLGRKHTVEEAEAAVRLAQSIFPRSSFDLIYARPGQTLEDWRDELTEAVWLSQGHLSLYQLTIEMGTRFYDLFHAGKLKMPDEDLAADFYELTQELTAEAGLPAYEISNHARPGQESRHNLLYWRYGEYAGIGPGAHGRILVDNERHATATEKLPFNWQKRVDTQGHGLVTNDVLTWEEEGDELLVMGLRLREGIDPRRFTQLSGRKISDHQIRELKSIGFVETLPNGNLRVTERGWPVLDAVVADLAA